MNKLVRHIWLLLALAAVLLSGISILAGRGSDYTGFAARRTSRLINTRLAILDGYMDKVAALPSGEWPRLEDFPEDMVVYRYEDDSLRCWCNQFTLDNDDLSRRVFVERLRNLRFNMVSPLLDVDTTVNYINMGPKWYLVKGKMGPSGCWVIGGLEVKNNLQEGVSNGINPRLRLSDRFLIFPIAYSGGEPVEAGGKPLLKIIRGYTQAAPLMPDPVSLWVSVFLLIVAAMIYLAGHRSLRAMWVVMTLLTLLMGLVYLLGRLMGPQSEFFSPTVYADGPFLYSLGAVLIVGIWLVLLTACLYLLRIPIYRRTQGFGKVLMAAFLVIAAAGLAVYIHLSFRSIILNSNISMRLYVILSISRFTVYVYVIYLALCLCVVLLLQMFLAVLYKPGCRKVKVLSSSGRVVISVLAAAYLVGTSSVLGLQKEESRVGIWANRLAIDRDLGLELQLRRVENAIANDPVIPALIAAGRDYRIVLNRITENYMSRVTQDYDVSLYMFRGGESDPGLANYFADRMRTGTAIADSSLFYYSRSGAGRVQYTGLFVYYNQAVGAASFYLGIESKADKAGRGYASLLGNAGPGAVSLPLRYSYGKYLDDKLVSYQGDYAYPTVLGGELWRSNEGSSGSGFISTDRYRHFVTQISPEETIIISRQDETFARYMVACLMIAIPAYLGAGLIRGRRRRRRPGGNFFKSRITTVMYISLTATLVVMATISVAFVNSRNERNVMNLMTGKIGTIQSLVNAEARFFSGPSDFTSQEFGGILEDIAANTKSDISLYTTYGSVFKSTYPEAFSRMYLGSRLDEDAFRNIMGRNLRYYIHKERFVTRTFYCMYAPVFNDSGRMLAIIGAPYTDSGLDFRAAAAFHLAFVVTLFLLLMIMARFVTGRVVDSMFRPLEEMGRKMNAVRTEGLEYIIYDSEDEISGLVRAYNLMVHDLSESSKQAAQLERDKAWSEMARQVAHEIKNPLTPIKLQIQRIIRLKSKNDPQWEEKFDSIAPVVLESIDQLTDTANEFSTFAKLYSEEPVDIDLDELLHDQVALFDEREHISFQYIGLRGAVISGPKPQLTRVFVNLLTNAVQAIEGASEITDGQVVVSLRNSTADGFYDIVFEDNGPGVPDENRSRLFTPNFTTKSGGAGIGLAICKNILERCGGDISYSRSFTLGGACFTIRFPRKA